MNRSKRKKTRSPEPTKSTAPHRGNHFGFTVDWLIAAFVFLFTAAAFFPTLQNDFVDFDDADNLLKNTKYRGLGWTQIHWMFTTFHLGHYQPLSWVSLGLDYLIWGMEPVGYHLTSVVIHAANAVLVYFICRRLILLASAQLSSDKSPTIAFASAFAALFFAVHPLRVESVAWVTERRDVLSAHFLLWTLVCYMRGAIGKADKSSRRRWMIGALISYLFSLLSKATGMTLPVVLLALDVYPLRRINAQFWKESWDKIRTLLIEKIPFTVLAGVFAGLAIFAQEYTGALSRLEGYPWPRRIAQAFYGLVFYCWKTLWPVRLSPFYQLDTTFDPWDRLFVLSAILVLATTVLLLLARNRWPAGLAAWIWYVVIVSPVLGFAQSGLQLVADRYSYVSCLSWAILAGAGLLYALRRWAPKGARNEHFWAITGVGGLVLFVFAAITWNQTQVWRNSESLWRHAVSVDPESNMAHINLGNILKSQNRLAEATQHYQQAIKLRTKLNQVHFYLAHALAGVGRLDEAVVELRKYIEKDPTWSVAHVDLGTFLGRQGKTDEELQELHQGLKLDPQSANAHFALGSALAKRGELEEAKQHLRRAIELNPDTGDFYFTLGNLLVKQNLLAEATETFRTAILVAPGLLAARNNLGRLLAAQGDLPAAIDNFYEALRIDPTYAPAHESLAQALAEIGRRDEAIEHYREAVRLTQLRSPMDARP